MGKQFDDVKKAVPKKKTKTNKQSLAVEAHNWQGYGQYPGHDTFQNGVISKENDKQVFYALSWKGGANKKNSASFLTDQATTESCVKKGVLDGRELSQKLQVSYSTLKGKEGVRHCYCNAYVFHQKNLDRLKTQDPKLYKSLTGQNPSNPKSGSLKCAYGITEANSHLGKGGGNQYYINQKNFRKALDAGVFTHDAKRSYSTRKGNMTNPSATKKERRETEKMKTDVIKREALNQKKSSKQINADKAKTPKVQYQCKPDPAYYKKSKTKTRGK